MAAFLFVAFWVVLAVFIIVANTRQLSYQKEKDQLDAKIRLYQADIAAVNADTNRVKAKLPPLVGVSDAFTEVISSLHVSDMKTLTPTIDSLQVQSEISSPATTSTANISNDSSDPTKDASTEVNSSVVVSDVRSDETIEIRFNSRASVVLSYFKDFDMYQAHLCLDGLVSEKKIKTYTSDSGMNEEMIINDACRYGRSLLAEIQSESLAESDKHAAQKAASV